MGPEHQVAQAFLRQKKQKQATKQIKKEKLIVWIVAECKYK